MLESPIRNTGDRPATYIIPYDIIGARRMDAKRFLAHENNDIPAGAANCLTLSALSARSRRGSILLSKFDTAIFNIDNLIKAL
ncbi:MAG TPA: hypothetical protein VNS34_15395 [Rhizobiaceae bacterium]|nr:hypothetical protein [Rhizobiaceae bacterium]